MFRNILKLNIVLIIYLQYALMFYIAGKVVRLENEFEIYLLLISIMIWAVFATREVRHIVMSIQHTENIKEAQNGR